MLVIALEMIPPKHGGDTRNGRVESIAQQLTPMESNYEAEISELKDLIELQREARRRQYSK